MDVTVSYAARSEVRTTPAGLAVALASDLRRDRVAFDAVLRDPVRFREAIGALHEIVVGDGRRPARDRSAWRAHRARESEREDRIRRTATAHARVGTAATDPGLTSLEAEYRQGRLRYWKARRAYTDQLRQTDPRLWRLLMPFDPVVTVAPDAVLFEVFSGDESSYGCLSVDRDRFTPAQDVSEGTTNIDYSWNLYEHFQTLRSYRETRLTIDPAGVGVATSGPVEAAVHEEKIPLPPSWLRGFLQVQTAMGLAHRRVRVGREGLYNILAFLRRHRAAKSPRALRFELTPGQPPSVVLEPWEQRIVLHGPAYDGPKPEVIRTWGRDRLRVLARLLPVLDSVEVDLLGTGLPSFWTVRLGGMSLVLGLSGWTRNDWTGANALGQLLPPVTADAGAVRRVAATFADTPARSFDQVVAGSGDPAPTVAASLVQLAGLGLVIRDLPAGVFRWREVMPVALSAELIGPEDPETVAARSMATSAAVQVTRDERSDDGLRHVEGTDHHRPITLVLDGDGRIVGGKCSCSHHHTSGLRRGPCRHLQALRLRADAGADPNPAPSSLAGWFQSWWN